MRFSSSDDSPIFMIRLVAERGGIMKGGLAHVGRVGVSCAMRSATSWRAVSSSVPRSKMSWIAESWATDFERSSSRPGRPLSCSSIGTVINSSTSSEELPSAIVWTSTRGGANSGNTSTFALGIWATPKAMIAVAPKSTSQRNRKLRETIQRITTGSAVRSLARDLEFRAIHLGGPDGHDPGTWRRAAREQHPVTLDADDLHLVPHVLQELATRIDVGLALWVVQQCGVGHDLALPAAAHRRGAEADPPGPLGRERHSLKAAGTLDRVKLGGLVSRRRFRFHFGATREQQCGNDQYQCDRGDRRLPATGRVHARPPAPARRLHRFFPASASLRARAPGDGQRRAGRARGGRTG